MAKSVDADQTPPREKNKTVVELTPGPYNGAG